MFGFTFEQIIITAIALAVFGKPLALILGKIPFFAPLIPVLEKLLTSNGNGNGKNGNGNGNGTKEKLGEIDEHLELLTSNHLDHVQKGIDKLIEMQERENVTLALMAQSLEDIKDNLK